MSRWGRCVTVLGVVAFAVGVPAIGRQPESNPAITVGEALRLDRFDTQEILLPAGRQESLDITVNIDGAARTMRLRPYSLRAEIFQVMEQGADGIFRAVKVPPPSTYRGEIVGHPGGRVAASIVDGQLHATIDVGTEDYWYIQPASSVVPASPRSMHVVYRGNAITPGPGTCGTEPGLWPAPDEGGIQEPPTAAGVGFHQAQIAFDVDNAYYVSRGFSTATVTTDIETLLNTIQLIYEADVGITYSLTTILIRTNVGTDPYTTTNPGALLSDMVTQWNTFHGGIVRDVAHLMTGKGLDGSVIGIAAVATVCKMATAYGLSESGFTGNYAERVSLTAHELGHNWAGLHCNGEPDCAIMCAGIGGCTGQLLNFGSSSKASIRAYRNAQSCLTPTFAGLKPHLVWRHGKTGHNSIWIVDGSSVPLSHTLPSVRNIRWKMVGSGDFNNNGEFEVLWRHDVTGGNVIWFLDGITRRGGGLLPKLTDPNWLVAGTGDFDGDGRWDILWRHAGTGGNLIWFLNGLTVTSSGPILPTSLMWDVVGTGDFNGDGKADILWRDQVTGANEIWLMNGTVILGGSGPLPTVAANWEVVATGDFNGDGMSDILWRNRLSGANAVWLMNGTAKLGGSGPLPVLGDRNWEVVGTFDADRDGRSDILWRNRATGENSIWIVVGSAVISMDPLPGVPDTRWIVGATSR